MIKIGIIGPESYNNQLQIIKLFQLIKQTYGKFVSILSGGNNTGVEAMVKKLALELELDYKEYNPSYTGKRMYSALSDEYYGKEYHISHLSDRYRLLIYECDYLIIFINKGSKFSFELESAKKTAIKAKKPIRVIN